MDTIADTDDITINDERDDGSITPTVVTQSMATPVDDKSITVDPSSNDTNVSADAIDDSIAIPTRMLTEDEATADMVNAAENFVNRVCNSGDGRTLREVLTSNAIKYAEPVTPSFDDVSSVDDSLSSPSSDEGDDDTTVVPCNVNRIYMSLNNHAQFRGCDYSESGHLAVNVRSIRNAKPLNAQIKELLQKDKVDFDQLGSVEDNVLTFRIQMSVRSCESNGGCTTDDILDLDMKLVYEVDEANRDMVYWHHKLLNNDPYEISFKPESYADMTFTLTSIKSNTVLRGMNEVGVSRGVTVMDDVEFTYRVEFGCHALPARHEWAQHIVVPCMRQLRHWMHFYEYDPTDDTPRLCMNHGPRTGDTYDASTNTYHIKADIGLHLMDNTTLCCVILMRNFVDANYQPRRPMGLVRPSIDEATAIMHNYQNTE